jgi:hypothetical protein
MSTALCISDLVVYRPSTFLVGKKELNGEGRKGRGRRRNILKEPRAKGREEGKGRGKKESDLRWI